MNELTRLKKEIYSCRKCFKDKGRRHSKAIPATENYEEFIGFVGEVPGISERGRVDILSEPVRSFISECLSIAGFSANQFWSSTLVKCPQRDELIFNVEQKIENCNGYLRRELALFQTGVVCLLGEKVTRAVLNQHISLMDIHGRLYIKNKISYLPMLHPALCMVNSYYRDLFQHDLINLRNLYIKNP